MSEAYERERQNNSRLDELASKVSALRGVTVDIYDNARNQEVIDTNVCLPSLCPPHPPSIRISTPQSRPGILLCLPSLVLIYSRSRPERHLLLPLDPTQRIRRPHDTHGATRGQSGCDEAGGHYCRGCGGVVFGVAFDFLGIDTAKRSWTFDI